MQLNILCACVCHCVCVCKGVKEGAVFVGAVEGVNERMVVTAKRGSLWYNVFFFKKREM